MVIETTMTGSWFRTNRINELLRQSPSGEISPEYKADIEDAERRAIRDQLHPNGSPIGLHSVSNGEQRKAGYTSYLPNRFYGFSKTEKSNMPFSQNMIEEISESNPTLLQTLGSAQAAFSLPKIESKLEYHGEDLARQEARDAVRIAKEEGAKKVFLTSASPGVITIFYPRTDAYKDHSDYLFGIKDEMKKEYKAILDVDGIDLQIDAPDLGMGKHLASDWNIDFYDALPSHIDAINEAVKGLPQDRIRTHYCFGNYLGSHKHDANFEKILPELLRLKVGTLVGETANPRHEGDALILENYLKEYDLPKGLKLAPSVIDVKTPFVETPETVANRLDRFARIPKIDPNKLIGGTDCGFETFAGLDNVTYPVALQKLESLSKGAELESKRLNL
jgi:5-methyltetrahydropteroyltriglutamate--homocysteine methyltransferase